ncbi:hypothetical protein OE88DRAFT_1545993 [Heliocybe sulcata]|uniref:Uncharacterized protein n=1 Tax=Heliocybe sulcata TaxID=5364 RepID=A0A5C3N0Z6_9AGAM|nr:hypothetical protein OE88DRAFT_1545993 [Heliocybe sulcata]
MLLMSSSQVETLYGLLAFYMALCSFDSVNLPSCGPFLGYHRPLYDAFYVDSGLLMRARASYHYQYHLWVVSFAPM